MPALHISKVAVGCASLSALRSRQAGRAIDGRVPVVTRFRPKRAEELVGGSLYWILNHRLVARQRILGFAAAEDGARTVIELDADLLAVRPVLKRAHQGWRYLDDAEAPPDLLPGDEPLLLPPRLERALARLALV